MEPAVESVPLSSLPVAAVAVAAAAADVSVLIVADGGVLVRCSRRTGLSRAR